VNDGLLRILECPFCGGALRLQPSPKPNVRNGELVQGILGCECCAYPVVEGIPFIRTGRVANLAMTLLGDGRADEARLLLLDLTEEEQAARFKALMRDEATMTFRSALEVLSRDSEGVYLLYRFSDPTYLCARAVLEVVLTGRKDAARVLDVGGGAGHVARAIRQAAPESDVVIADIAYWKLWLARRFVEPSCQAVCCDASVPLPFARSAFSLTNCSDAFHYVWPRRLLAGEMMRATESAAGAIALSHLHNALCDNPSPGMPLTPSAYRRLFEEWRPRLFKQSDILSAVVRHGAVDLSADCADADLADSTAIFLIANRGGHRPQTVERRVARGVVNLTLNPLYVPVDGTRRVELRFPSPFYAEEFADARKYLPDQIELPADWTARGRAGAPDGRMSELASRHVLLDLPERYL
jgi:SAM-dependent methyltransferase/uncharacterized protein YbaR (Trm112 family)